MKPIHHIIPSLYSIYTYLIMHRWKLHQAPGQCRQCLSGSSPHQGVHEGAMNFFQGKGINIQHPHLGLGSTMDEYGGVFKTIGSIWFNTKMVQFWMMWYLYINDYCTKPVNIHCEYTELVLPLVYLLQTRGLQECLYVFSSWPSPTGHDHCLPSSSAPRGRHRKT